MKMTDSSFSPSETAGLEYLPANAEYIYSAGISTGGATEIGMIELRPGAHVVATTLDEIGIEYSKKIIAAAGLNKQIETKLEDVSGSLHYAPESFDYVYARLVLHYLSKQALPTALSGLHRLLRPDGRLFVVVRSTDCFDVTRDSATYDKRTGLTRYIGANGAICYRYFHTQQSIKEVIETAGFTIESIKQYNERLFIDYARQIAAPHNDNVIEVRAFK